MPIIYRPAHADDLQRASELVVRSMNDLSDRHGFGPMAVVRPPAFSLFSLNDDPHGLWVAEDADEILGFAFSWICGDLWFLAQLFVSPGQQGRRIGHELLRRTFEHAHKANAPIKALITFSFNGVSQALYIRHGLFPRCPIYNMTGAREQLMTNSKETQLRCLPLENRASHLHCLAEIDARVLGVSRAKHHGFLIGAHATTGMMLYAGGECVGYVYIADGHIGPLAVTRKAFLDAAFRTALNLAAEHASSQVSVFVPGPCDAALSVALGHGMRITIPMVLMSTSDFGNWAQYLPRNPGFM
jgi:GNAT superfamily N-acetyltransferase